MCEQAGYQHPPMDQCTLNPELCGDGGRCVDTVDGYTCECYDGFTLNPVTNQCEGILLQCCLLCPIHIMMLYEYNNVDHIEHGYAY